MRNTWSPLINYVLYNNSFTLLVVFLLLSGGTVLAANDDVREAVSEAVVSSEDTVLSIDNTFIIDVDVENFDFRVQVAGIEEDNDNYYVTYTYSTIEIQDGMWQAVDKVGDFIVAKAQLGENDLGLYIAEELKEFVDGQKRLLAETQQIERNLGRSGKVVERKYAGLIGRFLDPDEVTFDGYDPVAEPVEVAVAEEVDTETDEEETGKPSGENSSDSDNGTGGGTPTVTPSNTATSTTTDPGSSATSTATSTNPVDITVPTITLNGNASMSLTVGDAYSEQGASASDDIDGDLTGDIVISGSVDTATAGEYEVTYSVSDSAGNSTSATRAVTVVDAPEPEPEPEPEPGTATSTES